jgi:hypothetical protein
VWAKATDLVPVARDGDILAPLDVRNKKHPRLLPRDAADMADGGDSTSLEILLPNRNEVAANSND